MRKDSGLFIVGLLLMVIGLTAFWLGMNGDSFGSYRRFSAGLPSDSSSPVAAIMMGVCFTIAGVYLVFESGYFRRKK